MERLGIQVYAVTFESRSRVARYQARDPLPFPVLRDNDPEAYRRFGLGRSRATTIWGPATLWYYLQRLFRGVLPERAVETDAYQLGGNVLLRPDCSGGWIYRSSNPVDRPTVDSLLAHARQALHTP